MMKHGIHPCVDSSRSSSAGIITASASIEKTSATNNINTVTESDSFAKGNPSTAIVATAFCTPVAPKTLQSTDLAQRGQNSSSSPSAQSSQQYAAALLGILFGPASARTQQNSNLVTSQSGSRSCETYSQQITTTIAPVASATSGQSIATSGFSAPTTTNSKNINGVDTSGPVPSILATLFDDQTMTRSRPTVHQQHPHLPSSMEAGARHGALLSAIANASTGSTLVNVLTSMTIPQPPTTATFVKKLFQLVNTEPDELVGWAHGGTAFEIKDPKKLERLVLPKYFRHSKFKSFARQLCFYSFKNVSQGKRSWVYKHELFRQGHPQLLDLMRRRTASGASKQLADTVAAQALAVVNASSAFGSGPAGFGRDSSDSLSSAFEENDDLILKDFDSSDELLSYRQHPNRQVAGSSSEEDNNAEGDEMQGLNGAPGRQHTNVYPGYVQAEFGAKRGPAPTQIKTAFSSVGPSAPESPVYTTPRPGLSLKRAFSDQTAPVTVVDKKIKTANESTDRKQKLSKWLKISPVNQFEDTLSSIAASGFFLGGDEEMTAAIAPIETKLHPSGEIYALAETLAATNGTSSMSSTSSVAPAHSTSCSHSSRPMPVDNSLMNMSEMEEVMLDHSLYLDLVNYTDLLYAPLITDNLPAVVPSAVGMPGLNSEISINAPPVLGHQSSNWSGMTSEGLRTLQEQTAFSVGMSSALTTAASYSASVNPSVTTAPPSEAITASQTSSLTSSGRIDEEEVPLRHFVSSLAQAHGKRMEAQNSSLPQQRRHSTSCPHSHGHSYSHSQESRSSQQHGVHRHNDGEGDQPLSPLPMMNASSDDISSWFEEEQSRKQPQESLPSQAQQSAPVSTPVAAPSSLPLSSASVVTVSQ